MPWPTDPRTCIAEQEQLARAAPEPWRPAGPPELVAGCFVCFPRGPMGSGAAGDPAWAAAALTTRGRAVTVSVVTGVASAPYEAGLLALREGAVLEAVVRRLPRVPDVLLVDATGRDHPRRAGLALHLGATLGMPTVGVTHRPLLADGPWPPAARGTHEPLMLDGARVGAWLRVASRARPLPVHAAWRTDVDTAIAIVLASTRRFRTPEPLRRARQAARRARAAA